MYENIGAKIKSLATWVFVVEAISAIIGGIVLMFEGDDYFLIGLLTMLLGPVVAYVSTWLLYGFGQLIENSDIIANHLSHSNKKDDVEDKTNNLKKYKATIAKYMEAAENEDDEEDDEYEGEDDDEKDADEYIDINCPYCQAELSYTPAEFRSRKMICPMCDACISQ